MEEYISADGLLQAAHGRECVLKLQGSSARLREIARGLTYHRDFAPFDNEIQRQERKSISRQTSEEENEIQERRYLGSVSRVGDCSLYRSSYPTSQSCKCRSIRIAEVICQA